jgi:hypothetical protein
MEIIFNVVITNSETNKVHSMLRKTQQSDIVPCPDMLFEDAAWKEAKKPLSVTCNFAERYYLITFKEIDLSNEDLCERERKMYNGHDWNG